MSDTPRPKSICVFCGSSAGNEPRYAALAEATGKSISNNGFRFVYGGGSFGLMGLSARAAFNSGGAVLGIIPEFLVHEEGSFDEAELMIVPNMHVRKMKMYEESDGFIVLPGGIGTIEEAVEMLSWMRLQLHQKPLIFLSDNDYWAPLLDLVRHTISKGFTPEWLDDELLSARSPDDALTLMQNNWTSAKPTRSIWVDYDAKDEKKI